MAGAKAKLAATGQEKARRAHSPVLAARDALETVYEGQYNIQQELARGAFGVVHEGRHVLTGAEVAIKIYTSQVSP